MEHLSWLHIAPLWNRNWFSEKGGQRYHLVRRLRAALPKWCAHVWSPIRKSLVTNCNESRDRKIAWTTIEAHLPRTYDVGCLAKTSPYFLGSLSKNRVYPKLWSWSLSRICTDQPVTLSAHQTWWSILSKRMGLRSRGQSTIQSVRLFYSWRIGPSFFRFDLWAELCHLLG